MVGRRKRIGFLWPADGVNEAEFRMFVPPEVDWLVARYDAGTDTEDLTTETLSAYAEPEVMRRAARGLRAVSPDVVACGDHAASFITGAAKVMAEAVADVLGCPVTTVSDAATDAFTDLGARKIAVVSPYAADVTQALLDDLRRAGVLPVAHHVFGATSEEDIGTRDAFDWLPEVLDVIRSLPERPDALFLAGGGVCFAAAIERFEAETGVPVVTAPGALVRKSAILAGMPFERPGLGRLFRPKPGPSAARVRATQSTGTKSFVLSDTPPVFVSGNGPWLMSETGRAYLDFACGSGTSALGHGHPKVQAAMEAQSASGITHLGPHFHAPVQARLYDLLRGILPDQITRFHPSVSGSEATEVALKAAMHATGARRFVGFEGGYHGRTFGALSVSGARGKNETLAPFAPCADILPFPVDVETGERIAAFIRAADPPLAGVIIEPVQATAGLRAAHPAALATITAAAQQAQVPLIVDEVFTGFGRTGRMFSFESYGLTPDLIILAKSFGGGLPAGLVAGTEPMLGHWPKGVQTSTFQLHPLAAATSEAFLTVLLGDDLVSQARGFEPVMQAAFAPCLDHPAVVALRGQGAFWALEMSGAAPALTLRRAALETGLLTWECGLDGETVGLVPPLVAEASHIWQAAERLQDAMSHL